MTYKPSFRRQSQKAFSRARAGGQNLARRVDRRSYVASCVSPRRVCRESRLQTQVVVTILARRFHRNQQYSIIALTNGGGNITERYAYGAYGKPTFMDASGTEISGSADGNRILYTGREYEESIGLYYFRARWYSPSLGRFLSRDPIGYVDGPNRYINLFYLTGMDPSGLRTVRRESDHIGFDAELVWGGGAGAKVDFSHSTTPCPGGGVSTTYGASVSISESLGASVKVNLFGRGVALGWKVASISETFKVSCNTPCCSKKPTCCKSCYDITLALPLALPFTSVEAGALGFGIQLHQDVRLTAKVCVQAGSSCPASFGIGVCAKGRIGMTITGGGPFKLWRHKWYVGEEVGGCTGLGDTSLL